MTSQKGCLNAIYLSIPEMSAFNFFLAHAGHEVFLNVVFFCVKRLKLKSEISRPCNTNWIVIICLSCQA
jgi:hypothetical protein